MPGRYNSRPVSISHGDIQSSREIVPETDDIPQHDSALRQFIVYSQGKSLGDRVTHFLVSSAGGNICR
jgi:hypothetical protein